MPEIGDYKIIASIGTGGTASVYSAYRKSDGCPVALKAIPSSKAAIAVNEIEMYKNLNHEGIVKLYDSFSTSKYIFLVMELCEGNLSVLLNRTPIPERTIKKIIRAILLAVRYMHGMGVMHRDLKLSNVLIQGDSIKICDLGLACHLKKQHNTFCGTPEYIAPEIKSRLYYDQSIDIYSIGVITQHLLTGRKIIEHREIDCSDSLKDLLFQMLHDIPDLRIGIEDALSHPCFYEFYKIPFYDLCFFKDFIKESRFGIIKKENKSIALNNSELRMENKKVKFYKNNTAVNPIYLGFRDLKIFLFLSEYLKLLNNKTPKIIVELEDGKFFFMHSNNFVCNKGNACIKKKDEKYFSRSNILRADEIEKDIKFIEEWCLQYDKNMVWNPSTTPHILEHRNGRIIKKSESTYFPRTIEESTVGYTIHSVLLNKEKFYYEKNIGWIINNTPEYIILFYDGIRMNINGIKNEILYFKNGNKERYDIKRDIPVSIKERLRIGLILLEKLIRVY
ncbi:putative serine/threonine-protein kinase [Astathelohania contejeani]|uniref:Serine/threonine-protein kinase n=1 Tax=Astathelohania contejeani TaxID=164912 RepID=A0ABQ7I066_9MICR|nr:putative serine/threonine-protein kinase [Thelohania contejeani]